MSYEPKDNSGTLFKNDRKQAPNQPDYKGKARVGNQEWEMSAWIKDGKNGKFMSFSFSAPWQKPDSEPARPQAPIYDDPDINDDIPF